MASELAAVRKAPAASAPPRPAAPPATSSQGQDVQSEYAAFTLDASGVIDSWNNGAQRMLGYRAEEIVGLPFAHVYGLDEASKGAPEKDLRSARAEGRVGVRGTLLRRDKSEFYANTVITYQVNPATDGGGYSVLVFDVTRRMAEQPKFYEAYQYILRLLLERSEKLEQTLASLEATDKRLNLALEGGQISLWDWDLKSGKVYRDDRLFMLLGYRASDVDAAHDAWERLIHPDDLERMKATWAAHFEGRTSFYECEYRVRATSGEWKWILARGKVVERGPAGDGLRALGTRQDITARKHAELKLETTEERLRLAMEGAQLCFWDWDVRAGKLNWGANARQLLGLQAAGFNGSFDAFLMLVHADDRAMLRQRVIGALKRGETFASEFRLVLSDGMARWLQCIGQVSRDPAGEAARVVGVLQEITARKVSESALRESESRFRAMADSAPVMIWTSDAAGLFTSVNKSWLEFVGAETMDNLGADGGAPIDPDDAPRRASVFDEARRDRGARTLEYRRKHGGGDYRWLLETIVPRADAEGTVVGYIGVSVDINDRKIAEDELYAEKELQRVTLAAIGDAVISTDAHGRIRYMNRAAEVLTGHTLTESAGAPLVRVVKLFERSGGTAVNDPTRTCVKDMQTVRLPENAVLISRTGREAEVSASIRPILDADGRVAGTVSVLRDLSQKAGAASHVVYQTPFDAETGLASRYEFEGDLRRLLDAEGQAAQHAVVCVSLGSLRELDSQPNAALCHELLRLAGTRIANKVHKQDCVARIGDDSLGVVLAWRSLNQARELALAIKEALARPVTTRGGDAFDLAASVGVVAMQAGGDSVSAILRAIDCACELAKDERGEGVYVYRDDDRGRVEGQGHLGWLARIEDALRLEQFRLFGQHIVPLRPEAADNEIEVLVRLLDASGQVLPPGAFLAAARRYHVMAKIDRWVLARVTRLALSAETALKVQFAINVSEQSLCDESYVHFAIDQVERCAQRGIRLGFEFNEASAAARPKQVLRFAVAMKERGCRIGLDNFGSGPASLALLRGLPVDYVKIDSRLIRNSADDATDRAIVEAVCKVAATLKVRTIAEAVENDAVLEHVRKLGLDLAQGHIFAHPRPLDELLTETDDSPAAARDVRGEVALT
jgi:diguanylate cyclase